MGMAGTELSTAAKEFLNTPHSFKTLVLDSDAHAACLGVHGGKDGAIIIVGTGVIGYLINHNQTYRAGGYGFPHSDEGGGAWLGLELFRLTFKAIDQRILWTPMLKHFFAQFNNNAQAFYDYANTAKPSDYAKFAPVVFEFAAQDPLAKKLLISAAFEVDQIFAGLWQQSKVKTFPLALLGGVAPFITHFTSKELQKNIVERKFDAPVGAIMLVKQYLGLI
jgi:glucosamine kinase